MAPVDDRSPRATELRWFGAVVAITFGLIGAVVGWRFDAAGLRGILWAVGAGIALLYYGIPPLRVPLYLAWMALFEPVGRAISIVLLGLIYFGVLTPIAMLMAVSGRDRLGTRFDPNRSSYWIRHDPSGDLDRYFRQT